MSFSLGLISFPVAAQTGEPGTVFGEFSQGEVDSFEEFERLIRQLPELRRAEDDEDAQAEARRVKETVSRYREDSDFQRGLTRYKALRRIEKAKNVRDGEPQHRVPGVQQRLYNSILADELTRLIDAANAAITACDRTAYDAASESHRGLIRKYLVFRPVGADDYLPGPDAYDEAVIRANSDYFPTYPEDCKKAGDNPTAVAVPSAGISADKVRIGFGPRIDVDRPRITSVGRETGGGSSLPSGGGDDEPVREFVSTDDDVTLFGGALSVTLPSDLSGPLDWAKITIGYAEGDDQIALGPFEPGDGARLLLPGPEGDASGLSLGGNASFPNTIAELIQSIEVEEVTIQVELPIFDLPPIPGNISSSPVTLRLGYRDTDYEIMTSGTIPGFDGSFAYSSELSRTRWDAHLAIGGEAELFGGGAVLSAQVFGGPSLYDGALADELVWNLQAVNASGGGSIETDESEIKLIGGFNIGLEIPLGSAVSLQFNASAEMDHSAFAHRDGTDPTEVAFEQTERLSAAATLILTY
ncbi:MAG: hypothetical protein AAGE37_07530 [Pseudomonadota bacterium]